MEVETDAGPLWAKAVLVTVSTAVLASGAITFEPRLPDHLVEAAGGLPLGCYERVVMSLDGNPLEADDDTLIVQCTNDWRNAALLARVGGTDLAMLDIGGRHARDLVGAGPDAAFAYARDWLMSTFGTHALKHCRQIAVTSWCKEPWIGGSFSSANPGQAGARAALRTFDGGRIRFAGEACDASLWGTVGGAWASGEAAAKSLCGQFA